MRNRAKCKVCNQILESFHRYDYVTCNCGEISISGGNDILECSAKDWKNFLRVDDEGNTIEVKMADQLESLPQTEEPTMTRDDLIDMLEAMTKNIENLPTHAKTSPVNQYDLLSLAYVVLAIFKKEKKQ